MDVYRAYAKLVVKSVNDDERIIEGIASTPTPDRYGDIVEPKGAQFALPLPLLRMHDHTMPVGRVIEAKVTDAGIWIKAQISKVDEDGDLKRRLDDAWNEVKLGLMGGLSIGFRSIEHSVIDKTSYSLRFLKWEWYELSVVTVPANADATIQNIKSLDQAARTAMGRVVRLKTSAGDSAFQNQQLEQKMNIQEQIAAFEAKRLALSGRAQTIMTKSADEGRTLDAGESEEYDTIQSDIKSVDEHLVRLKQMEKTMIASATPIVIGQTQTEKSAAEVRGGTITVKPNVAKGTGFVRYAMALAAAKGNLMLAAEYAKRWDEQTPEVGLVLKAAVAAGTTTDAAWAGPLVAYQTLSQEFVELLRPLTIIGRISGFRPVPFNVRMPAQSTGGSYGWVGQGAPKPVTSLGFGEVTLDFAKAAGIIVLTEELVRLSNPAAENLVRADMLAGIAQFLDEQFIDPAVAEVPNVSPASVTYGVTPVTATGTTADHVRADVKALFTKFLLAGLTPTGGVWVMSNTMALSLSLMMNALGQKEFPGITMLGGEFMGLPVVASESVKADSGGHNIALVHAPDILLADDGQVMLDASREASLQMVDNPQTGAQSLVSLWQNNLVGLRAERWINWKKRRSVAVQYIADANYAG